MFIFSLNSFENHEKNLLLYYGWIRHEWNKVSMIYASQSKCSIENISSSCDI